MKTKAKNCRPWFASSYFVRVEKSNRLLFALFRQIDWESSIKFIKRNLMIPLSETCNFHFNIVIPFHCEFRRIFRLPFNSFRICILTIYLAAVQFTTSSEIVCCRIYVGQYANYRKVIKLERHSAKVAAQRKMKNFTSNYRHFILNAVCCLNSTAAYYDKFGLWNFSD